MVRILVEFEFIPEHAEAGKELLSRLGKESLKEEGCFKYEIREDANDANVVVIFEQFGSRSEQEFHKTTPHYIEILQEKLPSMIQSKKVRFLNWVDITHREY